MEELTGNLEKLQINKPVNKNKKRKNVSITEPVTMKIFSENKAKPVSKKKVKKEEIKEETVKVSGGVKLLAYHGIPKPSEFDTIMKSFFIQNHKYVGLQVIDDKAEPVFFIILDKNWTETDAGTEEISCIFFGNVTTEVLKDQFVVVPKWDEVIDHGVLPTNCMYNCIPFDEEREYQYTR